LEDLVVVEQPIQTLLLAQRERQIKDSLEEHLQVSSQIIQVVVAVELAV
jgi:hypothetical protein